MTYSIRIISTYPPRKCGIGTFSRDLASALEHFTGEVGSIRIAAIDKDQLPYSIPVDLVIDQYDPQSWKYAIKDIITRAAESPNPSVILLQHEYGLDPDDNGNDGDGTNFIQMAKAFYEKKLTSFVYLHTVLDEPDSHQLMVLKELANYTDGLIVTTEKAVENLSSDLYGISHDKLKHIDHGIRMHHPSQYDRLKVKTALGLKDMLLATTLGLLSTDKGIQYAIRGFDVPKGTGFYALPRTAATMAARSGDPFAVQRLLGHANLLMATRYVQDVSKQTDKVINKSRMLIVS